MPEMPGPPRRPGPTRRRCCTCGPREQAQDRAERQESGTTPGSILLTLEAATEAPPARAGKQKGNSNHGLGRKTQENGAFWGLWTRLAIVLRSRGETGAARED